MDTVDLARLQFALTAGAHYLFVALTLGLATLVAVIQTRATFGRSPVHLRMTRFWGQLYIINYAMGIVTGLVMEFQLGLSWSGLTDFAGNAFGAALALETVVAFFVEATFLGLWIFGWERMNRWAHLSLIWVVTLTAAALAAVGVLTGLRLPLETGSSWALLAPVILPFIPLLVAAQAWVWWIFRHRVTGPSYL